MRRRIACLALALCLWAAWAGAAGDGGTFSLRFEEGFSLSLPEGWVSYPPTGDGVRYALGDGAGRYLYILAGPTGIADFEGVRSAIEARGDCDSTSRLELDGRDFAAFVAPGMNASGCSTVLDGQLVTFLFTPQDDSGFMLTVAGIMDSFRVGE